MITITGLHVRFGGTYAVEDFDLVVPDGQTTVIIGESGSGKSVMLSAILQILPREARVTGSVRLGDTELMGLPARQFRRIRGARLAYIPQGSGNSLNPLLTTGFQIAEPLMEHHKTPKKQALRDAIALMRRLNMGDEERVAQAYPHTLSGGMKQRALIAMGVASDAPDILADEPTKGLDRERIAMIEELFAQLANSTILCVSHDLRFTQTVADRVCVMYDAQKVEEADAAEFFARPLHPYAQMMLAALPENGMHGGGFATAYESDYHGCRFRERCPHRTQKCTAPPPMVAVGTRKVRCHLYADTR